MTGAAALSPSTLALRRARSRLLVAAIVVPIVVGVLRYEAQTRGWITLGQGVLLMALAWALLVGAVAWWALRGLKAAAEHEQAQQRALEAQARDLAAEASQRRDAQAELERSLRMVDDAERVTGRGSWRWDVTTDRAVWSDGMYRLFGLDPGSFQNTNENFLALVHPDDRARMGDAIGKALRAPGRFEQEYRLTRPDGRLVHVRGEGDVLPDHDGKARVLYGFVQDVTQQREAEEARRRAQEAMRASEARFRLLFEGSPVALAIKHADGSGFIDANARFEDLVGRPRSALLDPGFDHVSIWADRDIRATLLARLQTDGHAEGLALQVRRPDGRLRDVLASVRLLDVEGRSSFLLALQDVTETKAAEAAARRAKERFERVFHSSPVAISLTREDGAFVDVNEAYCDLVGRTRETLLGGGVQAPDVWEDPQERQRMIIAIRERGLVRDLELRIKRPDGEVRTTLASIEYIDLGGSTTILGMLQDVTDRLRMQEERAARIESEAELERLRRTDRFRTDFINNIAHELATPLTPLVLKAKTLAADRTLTQAQRQHVESVERNVQRLRALVDDMVGAADLQARNLALDKRRLNLTRELRAAVAAHQPAAERAGLRMDEPEDSGLTVSADPARLQLVMGHLIGNAIKFTPGGGRITVSSRRTGTDEVRVEVKDTGVGLTRKQVEGLWKPFGQAHDKSQRTDSGSGLGLYVTKGIVELHGGEVGVHSAGPGQGSTFWFTLPLATGHLDPLARPKAEPVDEGPRRNLNPGVADDPPRDAP